MSTSWQTVSVFISSTFNDMHAERDYLVKRVFPELREWCEKRKLRLVDIDLRWGVTEEDATRHKNVVKVCLDRIDECRPFFLCFLGQRRGWVPEKSDVSKETCETYKDLKGHLGNASVTELEILHAAINPLNDQDRAKYSFFYLRDDSYLQDLPDYPPLLRKTYTNEGIRDQNERDIADKELTLWRDEKIPGTKRPVHHYTSKWNKTAKTPELKIPFQCQSSNPANQDQWRNLWKTETGIEVTDLDIEKNPELAGKAREFNDFLSQGRLENFTSESKPLSEIILNDLKKAIEERFSDNREIPYESDLQKELDQQEQFLNLNSEGFIKRTGDFDQLDAYVNGNSRNLFVLTAPGGMGKTMLLANWIVHYQSNQDVKNTVLLYRFIGASDRSNNVDSVMRYLLREMKENASLFDDEIPADPEKLRTTWPELLKKVGSRKKTIIIIDAVNQLESGLSNLRWIPWQMQSGIKVIISFKQDGDEAEKLCKQFDESKFVTLKEVEPFTNEDDQKALISAYLRQYLKELDDARITELISIPGSMNPLFLKIVLSELRVFGAFTNLGEKIRYDFGTTPGSAFISVLDRLENDPSYSPVKPQIAMPLLFGLLSHARHGLSEEELVGIFLQELKREDTDKTIGGVKDTIRLFLRQVRPFCAVREGRHDFFYESFRIAAIDRYEGTNEKKYQRLSIEWHKVLADYFEQLPKWIMQKENVPTIRRAMELPYHLAWSGKTDHLGDLILAYEILETIVFGIGPFAAIEDISLILSPPVLQENRIISNKNEGLQLIQGALRLSAHILAPKPEQLPSQLVGRLLGLQNPEIRKFVEQLNRFDRYPWLRPISLSLASPGGSLIRTLAGHTTGVKSVAVIADGRRVISVSNENILKVWDLESGRELYTIFGHYGIVYRIAVTPDGRRAISGLSNGTLTVWDLENGRALYFLTGDHNDWYCPLAVTSDSRLAVSSSGKSLKVWDLETGQKLLTLTGHTDWISSLAVTPDGLRIISGSLDHTIKVWDLEKGRELNTFTGHIAGVETVALTPDGHQVISGSKDNTLKVWDLESGKELATLSGHTDAVRNVVVTPDGLRAISVSKDKTLKVWDLKNGREIHTLFGLTPLALTPDGHRVISGSEDNTLKVWDLESGKELATLSGHTDWILSVAVTPDGRHAVSGSSDRTLKIWDLEKHQKLNKLDGHADRIKTVVVTPDGLRAISMAVDMTMKIWDLKNGQELNALAIYSNRVSTLAVTPDGRWAVSVGMSFDKTLKVWDLKNGREIHTLSGHTDWIASVAVTHDSRIILSGSKDKTMKVWDLIYGRELATFTGHSKNVVSVALTPDGRRAVSGSLDMTMKVWDLENAREIHTLAKPNKTIDAVAVTPDGRWVVSGLGNPSSSLDKDNNVMVWDLERGTSLLSLPGHTDTINAVAMTPDCRWVVSGSSDKTLKIWDLDHLILVAEFNCDGRIETCGISDRLAAIIVGDESGQIYILHLEGVTFNRPNITVRIEQSIDREDWGRSIPF